MSALPRPGPGEARTFVAVLRVFRNLFLSSLSTFLFNKTKYLLLKGLRRLVAMAPKMVACRYNVGPHGFLPGPCWGSLELLDAAVCRTL